MFLPSRICVNFSSISHVPSAPDNFSLLEFYIHGSVHRDSILIRSNEMQQYAGVYLLQVERELHSSSLSTCAPEGH